MRREILIKLSDGPKTFREIYDSINFSPKPLLIKKEEYDCKIEYQWAEKTIENHLLNMEWNNLIKKNNDKYEITFPVFKLENSNDMEKCTSKIAENWIKIIQESKKEIEKNLKNIKNNPNNLAIFIEKIVEKVYEILKKEKILRTEDPNLKLLWAEQLRKSKFENWLEKNF